MFRYRSLSAIAPIQGLCYCAMLAVAVALAGCSSGGHSAPSSLEYYFDNFKTVVASADKAGYTPYWLGRGFSAGGLMFQGPDTGDFADEVSGGGVQMSYDAEISVRGSTGVVTLRVTVYSPAAWEKAQSTQDAPATKFIRVAGQEAKLSAIAGGTRPIEELVLLLKFGDTTVLAVAGAGGPDTPGGPDVNPLVDEATFLAVMQNLRPYPQ